MSSARATSSRVRGSAPLFAALGDETRLRLVGRLCAEGPLSIAALTAGTQVTRQAVTKHLRVMAQAGLLRSRRSGRQRLWELAPGQLSEARRCLEAISREWDGVLARLRAHVED
jgi:DNA-binding transcriptional ArsR family regulator